MTNIQVNGERFQLDTEWVVDSIQIEFTDAPGNAATGSFSVFDPDGPNAGNTNLPGASINSWTDTLIDVDFDGSQTDPYVTVVYAYSSDQTQLIAFDVNPDARAGKLFGNLAFSSPNPDSLLIENGQDLDTVTRLRLYWDNDAQSTFVDPAYTQQTTDTILIDTAYGMGLEGVTISRVEMWTGTFPGELAETYEGLSVAITAASDIDVVYNNGTDELTITTTAYDFSDCSSFNYTGNGSGQLQNPTHFVPTPTEIVVANAAFLLNGGTLTELVFFGPSPGFPIIATWTGSVDLF